MVGQFDCVKATGATAAVSAAVEPIETAHSKSLTNESDKGATSSNISINEAPKAASS